MKAVRFALLPLLLIAFASVVSAPVARSAASSPKSPDQMAAEALAKWKTVLKLTDEQAPQFESIMKDSYQKLADAKKEAAGDKAKLKTSTDQILKDRQEALSKLLTPEQMKTYEAQVHKNVSAAKSHMKKESK